MNKMTTPISVEQWLKSGAMRKSDNSGEPIKVMLVLSALPEENNGSNQLAEEAISLLTELIPDIQVAKFMLPKVKIHPCVGCYGGGTRECVGECDRNDLESDIYKPDDGMVPLYEKMLEADILIIASDVRWCGVNSFMQKFLERLKPFANSFNNGKNLLKNKAAGVLVFGEGCTDVSARLMSTMSSLGYALPAHAFVAFGNLDLDPTPSLSRMTENLFRAVKGMKTA